MKSEDASWNSGLQYFAAAAFLGYLAEHNPLTSSSVLVGLTVTHSGTRPLTSYFCDSSTETGLPLRDFHFIHSEIANSATYYASLGGLAKVLCVSAAFALAWIGAEKVLAAQRQKWEF